MESVGSSKPRGARNLTKVILSKSVGKSHHNFNTVTNRIDTIINQSLYLEAVTMQAQEIEKYREAKIEPGPTKGDALIAEIFNDWSTPKKKPDQAVVFKKVRPKSALHDKFARPCTGVHRKKHEATGGPNNFDANSQATSQTKIKRGT